MLRVTPFSITDHANFYNRNHLAVLAQLQRQLSSGVRFERPSDDPLATAQIRARREVASGLELQKSQINEANFQLNQSVSQLLSAEDLLTRAHQIAMDAPQQLEPAARQALTTEVESIIQRMESIIQSKNGTQYLYSGTSTLTPPLSKTESPLLAIPAVQYQGSRVRASMSLSDTVTVDIRYTADRIFFTGGRGPSLYFGNTGAKAGAGTDSGVGRANLIVEHTATSFAPGSGVQPGSDSVAGDTLIGPAGAHQLTIVDTSGTGAFGTVSLNGGPAIAFTNADTNLVLSGPRGEKIHLDTTAINAGFSGTVAITSTGTLSTDGGATKTNIDFTSNQVVVNSLNREVTNVDSSGIWTAGTNSVEYTDSAGALTALYELRDDLKNARGLDEQTLNKSFERRAIDLQRTTDQVLKVIGEQSSALEGLQELESRNGELQLEIQRTIVESESINVADVVTDLQNRQSLLQFSYATYSLLQNTNILQYLG